MIYILKNRKKKLLNKEIKTLYNKKLFKLKKKNIKK